MTTIRFQIVIYMSLLSSAAYVASAQQTKKPFTVTDEIGLTLFDGLSGGRAKVSFSPDGHYFVVWAERGRLDLDRVEDSLRFYRSQDIEEFLKRSDESRAPAPVWMVTRSGKEGPVISDWRWLPDSSGIAFLASNGHSLGDKHLVLVDLGKKLIEPLTSTEAVRTFDVHDRDNYVYTAVDPIEQDAAQQRARKEAQAAAIVGTEHSLYQLLFPEDGRFLPSPPSYLWAMIGGKRFEVKHDGVPVVAGEMALSPDGRSLVTTLPVREVPSSWEKLYPPPFESSTVLISTGFDKPAHEYVRIDLGTGSVQSLTGAPIGLDAGWSGEGSPSWSSDGRAVLLPNTFLSSQDHTPSRPCVAVVDLISNTRTCVEMLKRETDGKDYHLVLGAIFAGGSEDRVLVSIYQKSIYRDVEYQYREGNTWQVTGESQSEFKGGYKNLEVLVKEGLDESPLLIARDRRKSRAIWDPNPQLKNIELGRARVFKWKDEEGRELRGGLYMPVGYKPGQRYPLVIQTHGFRESEFRPSGFLTTGSAARSFAAAGILVLQIAENCPIQTPSEGSCAIAVYESAVNQLVSEGLADPERIGIIGFSRTCFYVMEALTASSLQFKAASITDGDMVTYLQYITAIDWLENGIPKQFDSLIGVPPFGKYLEEWLKRSPGFKLDKISAPLLVVAENRDTVLEMWEPYAGLRYLHKPVDLIVLNSDEHVLTNPVMRMTSQGGSVDWFRFWLKDEEDPDPTKAEQYARWRKLRP
jgi:dipeptidyl aminopeptidase/acylaminoacyl peptidase